MKDRRIKYPQILEMQKFIFLASKMLDRELDELYDLGLSQSMILLYLDQNPRVSQRDISCERDITPAAVSRHVEILVSKGYLRQEENKENKREHILELSAQGHDILGDVLRVINSRMDNMFRGTSRSEIDRIEEVFSRLLSELHENSNEDDDE